MAETGDGAVPATEGQPEPVADIPADISIEETFPDEAFREWVSNNCDDNEDGMLANYEIDETTRLYYHASSDAPAVSFEGIEVLDSLVELNLSGDIVNLDLSKLTKLEMVNITFYDEPLSIMDFSASTNLTYIWTGVAWFDPDRVEKVVDVKLPSSSKLETFMVDGMLVKEFVPADYPNLRTLSYGSTVENIDLSSNKELGVLGLSDMSITSLDLSANKELVRLSLSDMPITSLDVSNNTKITDLTLESLGLTELNTSTLSELYTIYLADMQQLRSVDLSGNSKMGHIDIYDVAVENLTIDEAAQLWTLVISGTELESLTLSAQNKLSWISIHETPLSSFDFSKTPKVSSLYLSRTNIKSLDISMLNDLDSLEINGLFTEVKLPANSENYYIEDGVLYEAYTNVRGEDKVLLTSYLTNLERTVFEVPEKVTDVVYSCFTYAGVLDTVVFPDKEVILGNNSFYNVTDMDVYFKGGPENYIPDIEDEGHLSWVFVEGEATLYYPEGNAAWEKYIEEWKKYNETSIYDLNVNLTFATWDPAKGIPTHTPSESLVEVPLKPEMKTESAVAKTTISQAMIEKAIADAKLAGGEALKLVIDAVDANATKTEVTISPSALAEMVEDNVEKLVIKNNGASLEFDAAILKQAVTELTGDVTFSAEKVDNSTLSAKAKALVGDRPVFDFTIADAAGNKLSNFGTGYVTVSIPYKLAAGEMADDIVAYYIADDGTVMKLAEYTYDAATEMLTFRTNHFSMYAVAYEDSGKNKAPATGDANNMNLWIMLAAISLGGLVVFTRKRRA